MTEYISGYETTVDSTSLTAAEERYGQWVNAKRNRDVIFFSNQQKNYECKW
jgi:hypothetical protein